MTLWLIIWSSGTILSGAVLLHYYIHHYNGSEVGLPGLTVLSILWPLTWCYVVTKILRELWKRRNHTRHDPDEYCCERRLVEDNWSLLEPVKPRGERIPCEHEWSAYETTGMYPKPCACTDQDRKNQVLRKLGITCVTWRERTDGMVECVQVHEDGRHFLGFSGRGDREEAFRLSEKARRGEA